MIWVLGIGNNHHAATACPSAPWTTLSKELLKGRGLGNRILGAAPWHQPLLLSLWTGCRSRSGFGGAKGRWREVSEWHWETSLSGQNNVQGRSEVLLDGCARRLYSSRRPRHLRFRPLGRADVRTENFVVDPVLRHSKIQMIMIDSCDRSLRVAIWQRRTCPLRCAGRRGHGWWGLKNVEASGRKKRQVWGLSRT